MESEEHTVAGRDETKHVSQARNASAPKPRTDLIAQGDKELRAKLLAEADVRRAIDHLEKNADKFAARRHLLATSTRLTPEMAPDFRAGTRRSDWRIAV